MAPGARILMPTVSEDGATLARALQRGASGYLLKTVDSDVLAGQRDEASRTMLSETLPALDRLQGQVDDLALLQQTSALAAGAAAPAGVDHAQTVPLAAGLAMLAPRAAAAWWLARSVTRASARGWWPKQWPKPWPPAIRARSSKPPPVTKPTALLARPGAAWRCCCHWWW